MSHSLDKKSISDKEENGMRIQRGKHTKEKPFVVISKDVFNDKFLSVEAKGTLGYLLCLPDDWISHPRQIAIALGIGKDKMYKILNELIERGYATKQVSKTGGKFCSVEYFFFEEPQDFQKMITVSDFPDTEKPDPVFQTLLNKNNTKKEEEQNKITHTPTPQGVSAKADRVRVEFGSHVKLTEEEHAKLCADNGSDVIAGLIEEMNDYCLASNPKGYSNYAAALRQWIRKREKDPKLKPEPRKFGPSSDQQKALENMAEMRRHAL